MIPPRKLKFETKKKENENYRFRAFLKENADEEELDRQFAQLHNELFEKYDCSRCRNCCKVYHTIILPEEVDAAANNIHMTKEDFIHTYLKWDNVEENYLTKQKPCPFLQKEGLCLIEDCKPEKCRKYPYTNQPERLFSLLGLLDIIAVCPVAHEIWERLKDIYDFSQ